MRNAYEYVIVYADGKEAKGYITAHSLASALRIVWERVEISADSVTVKDLGFTLT